MIKYVQLRSLSKDIFICRGKHDSLIKQSQPLDTADSTARKSCPQRHYIKLNDSSFIHNYPQDHLYISLYSQNCHSYLIICK